MVSNLASPLSLFTRRVMCLSSMARRKRAGIDIDKLIAAQDAADIGIVEDALGSGQAQRRSGDHHREAVERRPRRGRFRQPRSRTSANKWPSST